MHGAISGMRGAGAANAALNLECALYCLILFMPKSRPRKKPNARAPRRIPARHARAAEQLNSALSNRHLVEQEVFDTVIDGLPSECRKRRVTDPIESQELLHSARISIERIGLEYAQALGSYSSIFYLRRLPSEVFSGRLSTTGPYRRSIAEGLSALGASGDYYPADHMNRVVPVLNKGNSEQLLKLCGVAGVLSSVHASLRRAGKGQSIMWSPYDLPDPAPDSTIDPLLEVHDQRVAAHGSRAMGTATSMFTPVFAKLSTPKAISEFLLVVIPTGAPREVLFWRGPLSKTQRLKLKNGQFIVGATTLGELSRIIGLGTTRSGWEQRGLSSLIVFLRAMFKLAYWDDVHIGESLPSVGYFVLPTKFLKDILEVEVPDALIELAHVLPDSLPESADRVLNEVGSLLPTLWPLLPGPVIRMAGHQTAIDIHAASMWLERLLGISNDAPSDLVNARAEHFELVVQDIINGTEWRPPEEIGKVRGKGLRQSGTLITDVDAIALKGQTLLLISCKSIPLTPEYDAGVYANVRNVRTHLADSDEYWTKKIDFFRSHPKGSNYDFSGYEIRGLVCIPFVAYTDADQMREAVSEDGHSLRAVCSMGELREFMSK